jgi:non-specific serine/threonine protein kinase
MAASAASAAPPNPHPTRAFGRFELRQLLGRSSATMAWLAFDTHSARELVLHMPRVQPTGAPDVETWLHEARMAARLNHPHLAPVAEIGVQDHWPYLAVDRALGLTLVEWLQAHPRPAPLELVGLLHQALEGLAFAHEGGAVHQDLQLHHLLVDGLGHVRVCALDIVVGATSADTAFGALAEPSGAARRTQEVPSVLEPGHLRMRRDAAERDVLSMGLLLHHLLAGAPALDQADTGLVIARLPPHGRETIRLPWATPHPVTEALRVIVNRATARQPRQRYLNARTLLRALEGWCEAAALDGGGPLALLLDRLGNVGHLPALPGVGALAAGLAMLEGEHTREMTEPILRDMALSFELLRQVNTAQVHGTQVAGNGPILTIRRTVALVGVNGVRQAAAALRAWPGPLNEAGAASLKQLMDRVRLAGHAAQALRPPGYDAEVVYLIVLLQNLGRLMIQYHFAQEAAQIAALMQTTPAAESDDAREQSGMSEEAAAYAVLGVDAESLGAAVARHWGLSDEVLHMIRRLPPGRPVRSPDGDGDVLRMVASAANEAIDAITQLPAAKVGAALAAVVQRYGRGLGFTQRDLNDALHSARIALQVHAAVSPAQEETPVPPADTQAHDKAPVSPPSDSIAAAAGTAS